MFRPIDSTTGQRAAVTIFIDGRSVQVQAGQTLAMAMLAAAAVPFRHTAVSGAPRSPLCLMGVCFDCMVEVDGRHNVQSCQVEVQEGMTVRRPHGAPHAGGRA